jgi:hypothetical protein
VIVLEEGSSLHTPDAYMTATMFREKYGAKTAAQQPSKTVTSSVPASLELKPNYPNPFNPSTRIAFTVQSVDRASLKVFDIQGREISTLFDETAEPGRTYEVTFDGTGLSSGTYLYVLVSGTERKVGRMVLKK